MVTPSKQSRHEIEKGTTVISEQGNWTLLQGGFTPEAWGVCQDLADAAADGKKWHVALAGH